MKTAIIIGATGLVGGHLLHLLLECPDYSSVKIFVRKTTAINHPKLTEYLVDFEQPKTWRDLVEGDVLFSALGTTLKKAGSKAKQYEVDFTYQYEFAKAAAENQVPSYGLVSASGANPKSQLFYMRMKGELEREVSKLNFRSLFITRPNLLIGDRNESRLGEKLGEHVLDLFNSVGLFNSQAPIEGRDVARALIHANLTMSDNIRILTSEQLQRMANV